MVSSRIFQRTRRSKVLPNASGRVFIITEASSRTGIAAARNAAELGGEVLLLDSSSNLATTGAFETLKYSGPRGNFERIDCDFRDFQSVRRAIKIIRSRYSTIYCLISGAGTIPDEATMSNDDQEAQSQIHLSHILFATEMIPLLEAHAMKAGDARILNHSSLACMNAAKYFRENDGELTVGGADDFHRYLEPKVPRSAMRAPTAFKKSRTRPGTPLLVLARFVRIKKAKGTTKTKQESAGNSIPLIYSGIY